MVRRCSETVADKPAACALILYGPHRKLVVHDNGKHQLAVVCWVNTKKLADRRCRLGAKLDRARRPRQARRGSRRASQKPDYSKDTRVPVGLYGISYSPADGSRFNTAAPRIDPAHCADRTTCYRTSRGVTKCHCGGYGIRGMGVDRNGVVWVPLNSGHIGSFDRRKCIGPLNGPGAEKGEKCPEGASLKKVRRQRPGGPRARVSIDAFLGTAWLRRG